MSAFCATSRLGKCIFEMIVFGRCWLCLSRHPGSNSDTNLSSAVNREHVQASNAGWSGESIRSVVYHLARWTSVRRIKQEKHATAADSILASSILGCSIDTSPCFVSLFIIFDGVDTDCQKYTQLEGVSYSQANVSWRNVADFPIRYSEVAHRSTIGTRALDLSHAAACHVASIGNSFLC